MLGRESTQWGRSENSKHHFLACGVRYDTPVEMTGLKVFFDMSRRVCLSGSTIGGIDYWAGLNEPNISNPEEFNLLRFITINKKTKKASRPKLQDQLSAWVWKQEEMVWTLWLQPWNSKPSLSWPRLGGQWIHPCSSPFHSPQPMLLDLETKLLHLFIL